MKCCRKLVASFLAWTGMLGCVADAPDGVAQSPVPPDNIVRSPLCLELQKTYCDYEFDRCRPTSERAACDEAIQKSYCSEDDALLPCIAALEDAACEQAPDTCLGTFDPKPAQWQCEVFLDAVCQRRAECKEQPKGECLADISNLIPCSLAILIDPRFDDCLARAKALPCGSATEEKGLPLGCRDLITWTESDPDEFFWPPRETL